LRVTRLKILSQRENTFQLKILFFYLEKSWKNPKELSEDLIMLTTTVRMGHFTILRKMPGTRMTNSCLKRWSKQLAQTTGGQSADNLAITVDCRRLSAASAHCTIVYCENTWGIPNAGDLRQQIVSHWSIDWPLNKTRQWAMTTVYAADFAFSHALLVVALRRLWRSGCAYTYVGGPRAEK